TPARPPRPGERGAGAAGGAGGAGGVRRGAGAAAFRRAGPARRAGTALRRHRRRRARSVVAARGPAGARARGGGPGCRARTRVRAALRRPLRDRARGALLPASRHSGPCGPRLGDAARPGGGPGVRRAVRARDRCGGARARCGPGGALGRRHLDIRLRRVRARGWAPDRRGRRGGRGGRGGSCPALGPAPHAREEAAAFARLPAPPAREVERVAHLVLLQLLPALAEGDLAAFGAALGEVQRVTGGWFAPAQGGIFAPGPTGTLVERLREWGAHGVGQSSWGPAVYGIVDDAAAARLLAERARAVVGPGGAVYEGRFGATGARVWSEGGREPPG